MVIGCLVLSLRRRGEHVVMGPVATASAPSPLDAVHTFGRWQLLSYFGVFALFKVTWLTYKVIQSKHPEDKDEVCHVPPSAMHLHPKSGQCSANVRTVHLELLPAEKKQRVVFLHGASPCSEGTLCTCACCNAHCTCSALNLGRCLCRLFTWHSYIFPLCFFSALHRPCNPHR